MTPTRFPLCWPDTIPRAKSREKGSFKTSLAAALDNVDASLRLFGRDSGMEIKDLIISSNVTLGSYRPNDPGVAVWFMWDGKQVCVPVDRYATVEANLQAIHHIVEARRVELRHGTLALVRASMVGFQALPAPKPWWQVLDVDTDASPAKIEQAFRDKAKLAHPDQGGSTAAMSALTEARAAGLRANK